MFFGNEDTTRYLVQYHANHIATRLALSTVCSMLNRMVDTLWTSLITPGVCQKTFDAMCRRTATPDVKVFVFTHFGWRRCLKSLWEEEMRKWYFTIERTDSDNVIVCDPFNFERRPIEVGLTCDEFFTDVCRWELFGNDTNINVIVRVHRAGYSQSVLLYKGEFRIDGHHGPYLWTSQEYARPSPMKQYVCLEVQLNEGLPFSVSLLLYSEHYEIYNHNECNLYSYMDVLWFHYT